LDFASLFQKMIDESYSSVLPRSGGIYCKKNLIEETFYALCPDKREASVRNKAL